MLYVEVADNPYSHERGLMFRKDLQPNAGMLFVFRSPQVRSFWGLNTYLPLDVAFVSTDNKIMKIGRIKPLCNDAVSSDDTCLMAIEANEGYFEKNGITEGHQVILDKDNLGFRVVRFEKKSK